MQSAFRCDRVCVTSLVPMTVPLRGWEGAHDAIKARNTAIDKAADERRQWTRVEFVASQARGIG